MSLIDVPTFGVFKVGDVNVLLVSVCVPASVTTTPVTPSSKFNSVAVLVSTTFSLIFGEFKVLLVIVCTAPSSITAPVESGNVIILSCVGSVTFNRVSKSFAEAPSKTTASFSNDI